MDIRYMIVVFNSTSQSNCKNIHIVLQLMPLFLRVFLSLDTLMLT